MSYTDNDPFKDIVDSLSHCLTFCHHHTCCCTGHFSPFTNVTSLMTNPAPYSGSAVECNRFLLQCSLALEMQRYCFTMEIAKISFIISLSILAASCCIWWWCHRIGGIYPAGHLSLPSYAGLSGNLPGSAMLLSRPTRASLSARTHLNSHYLIELNSSLGWAMATADPVFMFFFLLQCTAV